MKKLLILLSSLTFIFSAKAIKPEIKSDHNLIAYAQEKMTVNDYVEMMRAIDWVSVILTLTAI